MKSILCYGDSNTYGLMPDLKNRYPRDIRWTGVLQQLLGGEHYVIEEGLGGRTTIWDDPIEGNKNGKKYLLPCLDSHKPLDLVIVILGTNDLKRRFSLTSYDVALSMGNLLDSISATNAGVDEKSPKVLLVAPVPMKDVDNEVMNLIFENSEERSKKLVDYFKAIAKSKEVEFLDVSDKVEISKEDGVHYSARGHRQMAELVAKKIREIL
ncbi:SGNH/GDSL hydrolase family protein [Ohessyouella blattaphilus]|uniref:SGNH/GDSL hydrolase family protein n=1 Tax=Ohessyouella blattaphilus TaxID=2949333 RepID=A0ABT1EI42_9FIRM|nr:SGNH/GDSL hydrolase family protein [Ohessyouella blattaphilus]MCP1110353.1 SGNH/GDSL hydrolase family protein [Ohessyouella blattaphilus]MCR8563747.1 SGNH/GDSL hydrolase family protein [Ohessyouella blattaphilus]